MNRLHCRPARLTAVFSAAILGTTVLAVAQLQREPPRYQPVPPRERRGDLPPQPRELRPEDGPQGEVPRAFRPGIGPQREAPRAFRPEGGLRPEAPPGRLLFLARVLDEEQRMSLREIVAGQRGEMRQLEERLRAARRELLEVALQERANKDLLRRNAEVIGKLETELALRRARVMAEIRPRLSPEQRERLAHAPGPEFAPGPGLPPERLPRRFEGERPRDGERPQALPRERRPDEPRPPEGPREPEPPRR